MRRRLVVGIGVLVALLGVAIGSISSIVMYSSLLARVDVQLAEAIDRANPGTGRAWNGGPGGPPATQPILGEGAGALAMVVSGSQVLLAGYIDESGSEQALTQGQQLALVEDIGDGGPITVVLGDDFGAYRVAATVLDSSTASGEPVALVIGLSLDETQRTVAELLLIVALATLGAVLLTVLLGQRVVAASLHPLERVVDTATRVSELPLASGVPALSERVPAADTDDRTEVGRMGAALNRLLGHVEQSLSARHESENRVRQFVADASHELRTPLASIRGYAELTRRGGGELPEDLARSLGRIESEAVRMTSLVEDLLLLARLDSGPSLVREPVDLRRVLADAISDAHAAGPGHHWALDLSEANPMVADAPVVPRIGDPRDSSGPGDRELGAEDADAAEVTVLGDERRIHQVFANLLANARVHTPPGTTVRVRLALEVVADAPRRMLAVAEIEDDGPGIPVEVASVLFDRFARGDSSRSRHAGSTGLGLAIVKAIVDAHDGTVSAVSEPGRTVFRVELPTA